MATYSLGVTGVRADNLVTTLEQITLPDTSAQAGGMQNAMRNGTQLLCKGPDGALAWYTLDPARSTPTLPVLVKV